MVIYLYREILTKAIIANGEKEFDDYKEILTNDDISKVLGCYILNHTHSIAIKNQDIYITGSYQVCCWYSYNNNTKCVLCDSFYDFNDIIPYEFSLNKGENWFDASSVASFTILKKFYFILYIIKSCAYIICQIYDC